MKILKKFEEMQQDETVSMNRLEKQMVGHDCRNTCYPMLGCGQSRVKSSVYFGWKSVIVPVVRLQLYLEGSVARRMSATGSIRYFPCLSDERRRDGAHSGS